MDEREATALLGVLAAEPAPASAVDVELAVQRGRVRRRNRRLVESVAAVVATVLVAVGFAVVRDHRQQQPVAPRPVQSAKGTLETFDPMVPYADFGWLPAGYPYRSVSNERARLYLEAHPAARGSGDITVVLTAVHQSSAGGNPTLRPAPPVKGATAYWVAAASGYPSPASTETRTARSSGPQCPSTAAPGYTELCWEYTPGGWAAVTVPDKAGGGKALARRVATGLRVGLRTPLKWPFHLSGEYAKLPVSSSNWAGSAVVSRRTFDRAVSLVLDDRNFADPPHRQRVEIGVQPHSAAHQTAAWNNERPNTTYDGHPAFKSPSSPASQVLAVYDIAGLDVTVTTNGLGAQGAEQVFRQLTLFDPDPGVWREDPLG